MKSSTISTASETIRTAGLTSRKTVGNLSWLIDGDVLYRSLFENSGLGVAGLGRDLVVHDANLEFTQALDRRQEHVIGRNFFEFLHPGSHPPVRRHFERLTDGRRTSFTDRITALRPSSMVFTGEMTGIAVNRGAHRAAAVIVLVRPERGGESQHTPTVSGAVSHHGQGLSEIDAKILEGIAKGMSTIQLSSQLFLSRQGVEYHVSTMLRRLKARNRAALVSRAYAAGILGLGSWPPRVLPEAIHRPGRAD
ncbi:LuxR C-terminal-related transcriptional regulator [Nocardia terpenica]|uniref:LuxR C-terminal-related transcriptional regulator n=1 Tax=Nocardia terpenica TaxID=455432 RepID=UPI0018E09295|nr:LuxR C-terminal-related transcriptional regulator [Nocardia terpenica]